MNEGSEDPDANVIPLRRPPAQPTDVRDRLDAMLAMVEPVAAWVAEQTYNGAAGANEESRALEQIEHVSARVDALDARLSQLELERRPNDPHTVTEVPLAGEVAGGRSWWSALSPIGKATVVVGAGVAGYFLWRIGAVVRKIVSVETAVQRHEAVLIDLRDRIVRGINAAEARALATQRQLAALPAELAEQRPTHVTNRFDQRVVHERVTERIREVPVQVEVRHVVERQPIVMPMRTTHTREVRVVERADARDRSRRDRSKINTRGRNQSTRTKGVVLPSKTIAAAIAARKGSA